MNTLNMKGNIYEKTENFCKENNLGNVNTIAKLTGGLMHKMFKVEKINDEFVVTDSKCPRDGSYYVDDMKNIFNKSVRKEMETVHTDGTIDMLDMEVEEQAKLYFHK